MYSNEEYIKKFNSIHKNKFTYEFDGKIVYRSRIIVICLIHGKFNVLARKHLEGHDCKKCVRHNQRCTKKNLLIKMNKKHNNFYTYDLTDYFDCYSHIIIICPIHGSFKQKVSKHMSGRKCRGCVDDSMRKSKEDFILQSNILHDFKYDYSKVSYGNAHKKVTIICPLHGEFLCSPALHSNKLHANGCPICAHVISRGETEWLDLLNFPKENRNFKFKINKRHFNVDGYDAQNKIIYEYYGDFWHGNLNKYNSEKINCFTKSTFKQLNDKTMEKQNFLKAYGFKMVIIWEDDFKKYGIEGTQWDV